MNCRKANTGGPKGIRTPDLCSASATLYQLSYRPDCLPRQNRSSNRVRIVLKRLEVRFDGGLHSNRVVKDPIDHFSQSSDVKLWGN